MRETGQLTRTSAKEITPEVRAQYRANARQAWADKGALVDVDKVRAIDRARFGGIVQGPIIREASGWFDPSVLWECQLERHAPLCNCDCFVNGSPVDLDSL